MYFSLRNFNNGKSESCQCAKDKLVCVCLLTGTGLYIQLLLALHGHWAFCLSQWALLLLPSIYRWLGDPLIVAKEFRDHLAHAPILWIRKWSLKEFSRPVSPRRSHISTHPQSFFHLKRLLPVVKWLPPFLSLHSRASFLISIANVLWKHACSAAE